MTDVKLPASTWRFVRLDQFVCPSASAKETVRKGFFGLLNRLRKTSKKPEEPVMTRDELQRLPEALCAQVAPVPDWTALAAALDRALQEGPAAPVQLVVGAPYSGTVEALSAWAGTQGVRPVPAPRPEDVLAGGGDWLRQFDEARTSLVIPHLERCYLRHHHGLALIRSLWQRLLDGQHPCLLGCSSWAWAYFVKALQADAPLPRPWVLEALNAERLQQWFGQLAGERFLFRQSDDGEFVIPPPAEARTEPGKEAEPSDFLVDLAAHSHGNPGVAWALWRHSLRLAPDEDEAASQADSASHTLWVKPWSQLPLPELAEAHDRNALQVLHALLLHEGLPASWLEKLLPLLSSFDLRRILGCLERQGVLILTEGEWRVAPLGYATVREALRAEGYPVDAL